MNTMTHSRRTDEAIIAREHAGFVAGSSWVGEG
jgi:hypothetical protein